MALNPILQATLKQMGVGPRVVPTTTPPQFVPEPFSKTADVFDELGAQRPRIHNLRLNECDTLEIVIRLGDGKMGNLTLLAATLAQIIRDRASVTTAPAPAEEGGPTEIQVGDGTGYVEPEQAESGPLRVAPEDLLNASKNRLKNVSPPPLRRVRGP